MVGVELGLEGGAPTAAERRRQRAHIAALRRDYGRGDELREWVRRAEAGHLRTKAGQLDRWRRSLAELDADRRARMGTIYLCHFERKLGDVTNPHGWAQHYVGWARDLDKRLAVHRSGHGARILAACNERGIDWRVVKTWRGTRSDERRLKDAHNHARFCPICQSNGGR